MFCARESERGRGRESEGEQVCYYGFVTTATIIIDGNILSGWIVLFSLLFCFPLTLSELLPQKSRALALILDS